jgi:hypothetical protein
MRKTINSFLLAASILTFGSTIALADGPFDYFALTPCRVVDTRNAVGTNGGPFMTAGRRDFAVRGNCGVPTSAKAVTLNITVTGASMDSHLTLFPSNVTMPTASTINFTSADSALANGAIVGLSNVAAQDLAVFNAQGNVHVIIDVTGYFE